MDTQTLTRRARWRVAVPLIAFVLVWLALILFRWEIRTHWWAYRLTTVNTADERAYFVACLASAGPRSLDALERVLSDERSEIRRFGVDVLARCDEPRAGERLFEMLRDQDDDVAEAAATALGERPHAPDYCGPLWTLLVKDEHDPPTARHAAVALQAIDHPAAHAMLFEALPYVEDPNVRAQIIESLSMLRVEEAVPAMKDMRSDERAVTVLPYNQRSALEAFAAQSGRPALGSDDDAELIRAAVADLTVRDVAIRALETLTGQRGGKLTSQPASSSR